MSRTVYLHVGIAKTGTTYLQRTLFANRELLRRHGTLYPGPDPAAHFLGSLDLRKARFKGYVYERAEGAWDRLVQEADAYDGATLISHETLAHARPEHIERAVTGFATDDVRVVVTARDLARQIPASWQEQLKNRGQTPYADFLASVFAEWQPDMGDERRFWGAQDVRGVVSRWVAAVGTDRVTVVTVPASGADRSVLWSRFAEATGLPALDYAFPDRDNSSLGVAEAELLRRLNPRLRDTVDWPRYDALIKKRLAETVLGPMQARGRLVLPARWRADVLDISSAVVDYLDRSGVRVVGDLEDLRPAFDPSGDDTAGDDAAEDETALQPGDMSDSELLDVALDALAAVAATAPPQPSGPSRRPPWLPPTLWNTLRRSRNALRRRLGTASRR